MALLKQIAASVLWVVFLRASTVISVAIALHSPLQASTRQIEATNPMPFHKWKAQRLQMAQAVLSQVQNENRKATFRTSGKQLLEKRLARANENIQLAKELSAHDYFVAYVVPNFPPQESVLIAATKGLKADQMAEILSHYHRKLRGPLSNPSLSGKTL